MAIGRPVWTGQIRLSLVAMPVKLYSATESSAKIAFHQIHEPSGKRIRYEKVVPGVGPVDTSEIVRGYQIDKDEYVIVTDDEIDDIKIEAKRTLDLTQFVGADEIDPIYFDRPYYVAPDGELAEDPFNVVREALDRSSTVGLGQIVMHGREHIAALKPHGKGMLLETLHYQEELRKAEPYFAEIEEADEPDEELVGLAEELIGRKTAAFDASQFEDRYSAALKELVERKSKGERGAIVVDEEAAKPRRGEVVDLMEALKKSLGGGGKPPRGGAAKPKAAPKAKAKSRKSAA